MKMSLPVSHISPNQRGIALLETLIAVLIFSIGVLGIIGLLGISVKSTADAKYRADAAYFANQIISRMWVDQANIASYAHNAADVAACSAAGGASATSAYAPMNTWLTEVTNTLPGATGVRQRIQVVNSVVSPPTPAIVTNIVTVTVCWHGPQDTYRAPDGTYVDVYHNYVATAQIGG